MRVAAQFFGGVHTNMVVMLWGAAKLSRQEDFCHGLLSFLPRCYLLFTLAFSVSPWPVIVTWINVHDKGP